MIQLGSIKPIFYKGLLVKANPKLHEQLVNKIEKYLNKNELLLDLGAGQGAFSQRLTDLGYNIIATDTDDSNFMCKDVEFYKINFNKNEEVQSFLKKFGNRFDAVFGIEVIEHVENPWSYIRLIKKLLKPGGYLFITTPNITSWLSRFVFLFKGKFWSFDDIDYEQSGHIAPISEWEMRIILKSENFKSIHFTHGGLLPTIWITKNLIVVISTILSIVFRPFMKGVKKGHCLIAIARKE